MQVSATTGSSATTSSAATPRTTSASNSSSSSSSGTGMVDYNSFLKLMIAELQNQDPMNPSDPTQYMSQLASFSAVGQQVQTNQKLDAMMTTSALSQANSAIGRTVTSADGRTTGKVSSVTIGTSGTVTAILADGTKLALGNGVTIS